MAQVRVWPAGLAAVVGEVWVGLCWDQGHPEGTCPQRGAHFREHASVSANICAAAASVHLPCVVSVPHAVP